MCATDARRESHADAEHLKHPQYTAALTGEGVQRRHAERGRRRASCVRRSAASAAAAADGSANSTMAKPLGAPAGLVMMAARMTWPNFERAAVSFASLSSSVGRFAMLMVTLRACGGLSGVAARRRSARGATYWQGAAAVSGW